MSKHRVPRTGRPMLTFFGDLIAKRECRSAAEQGRCEYHVRLFRTEAPGYVLAVHYRSDGESHYWAAHTPNRLEVADLFERYASETQPQGAALDAFQDAMQDIMLQAPELDELVKWSSIVAAGQ